MPAASLFDHAKARLIQNIHNIEDVGDMPYTFLAPILRHIENPSQLAQLEWNCPQLLGETGDLWKRFIKRDIPDFAKKPHAPRDPKKWSKVYRKLRKDAEREEEAQKEALKRQMQALQKDRKGQQTTIVDPRIGLTGRPKGFAFGSGAARSHSGTAVPTKTGKVAFDKLRRGIFDQKQARPKASMMPAHVLAERKRMTVQAPARMVRMQEAENAKQSLARSSIVESKMIAPVHTSRPAPEHSQSIEVVPQRSHLPEDQPFTAPKSLQHKLPSTPVAKRKREGPSFLHQPKRAKR